MNPYAAALLGAVAGTGLWTAVAALWPWRPALADEVAELEPRRGRATSLPASARPLKGRRLGLPNPTTANDLTCLSATESWFWRTCARNALIAATAGLALGGIAALIGEASPLLAAGLALTAAAVAVPVTAVDVHQRAQTERGEYQRALTVLLDQVAIGLSGGAGVDTALAEATETGAGPQFAVIRAELNRAHLLRQTPWEALGALGRRIGVLDFQRLAVSIALAGSEGARVKTALVDRAAALRAKRTAQAEAKNSQDTERMSVPVALSAVMLVLFVIVAATLQLLTST